VDLDLDLSAAPIVATPQAAQDVVTAKPGRLPVNGINLRHFLAGLEVDMIDQALARTDGNRNQAARLLGLNRTTLVEKLRKRGQ
jgi:DNA-binding NtrC family response regulator